MLAAVKFGQGLSSYDYKLLLLTPISSNFSGKGIVIHME